MDLQWFRSFTEVVRTGSFTVAATRLHLTQPAVSRHIRKLEAELGQELLDRTRYGIRPTSAGLLVAEFADDVLNGLQTLQECLRGNKHQVSGTLRIFASTTPGEFLVPGLVAEFRESYPDVAPQIMIGDSAAVLTGLENDKADVGFVGAKISRPEFRFEPVGYDEILLAVPRSHPLADRESIDLDDLEHQSFLEREDGSGTMHSLRASLREQGLQMPITRTVMVLGSTDGVLSAVEGGHGLGWVSSMAIEYRRLDRLAFPKIRGLDTRRTLYLTFRKDRTVPLVADIFIDWLRENAIQAREPSVIQILID
jgi:DNA-binding transcriptional LysR family regulator